MKFALLAVVTALLASVLPVSAQAVIVRYQLNIPKQSLDTALNDFAHQTGLQVARMSDRIDGGEVVGPVKGHLSAEDALKSLLAPRGLSYKMVNDRTFAIVKPGEDGSASPANGRGVSESSKDNASQGGDQKKSFWDQFRLAQATPDSALSPQSSARGNSSTQSGVATGAKAQQTNEDSVQEIVVTARKRDESLVNVPEPITAFSTKQIEQAGLRSLRDFTDLTPNVTFTTGAGASYPNIMVRGLAQAQNGEPPIAVVIDGVQVADPSLLPQDFGDVAQVEVLRGPQGSLYGRNAIGGAINITTRQPTNDFEGRVKASYGNASSSDISGDVSGPLVADKILFRLGGGYQRTDGQVMDQTTGRPADFGRNEFLRGRLIFNLSDALTLDLRANYGYDRIGIPTAEIVPNSAFDDYRQNFLFSDPSIVETRKLYDLAAKFEYKGEGFTVTSVSGYSHVNDLFYGDGDFAPTHTILQDVVLRVRAFTQELRIASPSEGRFRWLAGGFYQDRHTDNFQDFLLDDGTGQPIPGGVASLSHDVGSSKSWAPFGSISYDILPKLELTAGARYDQDKRTSVDSFTPGSAVERTFTSFQPKVQASYKPMPNLNLYATYGKGFSSGGFNPASSAVARLFKAQTADNFEIGVKGSTANGLLTYSLAAFRVYYHDQQFYYVIIAPASQNVVNIDKTRVDGAELELTAHLTKQLSISAGLGLTDAEILRFAANPAFEGNRTPQSEKYTANVTGQYTIALGDALDLRVYASYRRQGSEYWDSANTVSTGPKDFVNLRLFLEGRAGWAIGGFAQNLTNSQYPTIAIANVAPGYSVRLQSRLRTYGVQASYKF